MPCCPKLLPTLLLSAAAQLPGADAAAQMYATRITPEPRPVPGQVWEALPRAVTPITVDGITVYYRDGVFFRLAPAGYVVIRAPLGAYVPELPTSAVPVATAARGYWYDRGTFYAQSEGRTGFLTVSPPIGCAVPSLPTDVSAIADINGVLYYLYAGTFYRPVVADGKTVYLVADP